MIRACLFSNRSVLRWVHLFVVALVFMPSFVSADTDTTRIKVQWTYTTTPDYWPGNPDIPGLQFPQSLFLRWYDLDVDQAGNVYLLGRRQSLDDWLGNCLEAEVCAKIHMLVTKLDHHGHQQWVYNSAGRCDGGFRGTIKANSAGNAFFTEELYATWGFCPSYNTGTRIVGLGPSGGKQWEYRHEIDTSLTAGPAALTVGPWGHVYASSSDPGSNRIAIFDPGESSPSIVNLPFDWFFNSPLHTDGQGNLYAYGAGVAKFNSQGALLRNIASPGGFLLGAEIDRNGNSYCLWYLGNGYRFEKYDSNLETVWSRTPPIKFGAERVYLSVEPSGAAVIWQDDGAIKYSPRGDIVWNNEWDSDEWRLWNLAVDGIGNIMTLGEYGDYTDTFTVFRKFDPDGNMMRQLDSCDFADCRPENVEMLRVDSRGDIYITTKLHPWPPEDTREAVIKLTQSKTLVIRDAKQDSIPDRAFYAIKVHNNRPTYSEDTLGQFTTNFRGQVEFPMVGWRGYVLPATPLNPLADTIKFGDTIKIAALVYSEPAVRHTGVLGTMYSVHLDNADFRNDGSILFDTVEQGSIQIITLKHSEFRYNLVASVEWDAELGYLQGLESEFRQMSNYLYDVSDGQIRLDTVSIFDSRVNWNEADVHILADNNFGPVSDLNGMKSVAADPILMPRKWFYPISICRDSTYRMHPLEDVFLNNCRTIAHEFGHYGLGFGDEYRDKQYTQLPDSGAPRCQDLPAGTYGFMDYQYADPDFRPFNSEMSSRYRYQDWSCRVTDQWFTCGQASCWDYLEAKAERIYDGIFVPIMKPEAVDSLERITPDSLTYFPGPNDDLQNPDYDAGGLIVFPITPAPPASDNISMHVMVAGSPIGGVAVSVSKMSVPPVVCAQGMTTDGGQIWALGVNPTVDAISASGHAFSAVGLNAAGRQQPAATRKWLFAQTQLGSMKSRSATLASLSPRGDSLTMTLKSVTGNFPMVCAGTLTGTGWEYGIYFETPLPSLPQLEIVTSKGGYSNSVFSAGSNTYGCPVAEELTVSGQGTVWGVDQADSAFFFPTPYVVVDVTSPKQLAKLIGPNGDVIVTVDSANAGIGRAMILSSAYPPRLNGLASGAVQAGLTHSVSVLPGEMLNGQNRIEIAYSSDDFRDADGSPIGNEAALRIYRWSVPNSRWDEIGGSVNTSKHIVQASITQTGVYGAFTEYGGMSCCQGKRGDLNCSGSVNLVDLSTLVKYLTQGNISICCLEAADVNGNGVLNLVDLSALVSFLTGGGYVVPNCP